jgi:hypothetical protein
MVSEILFPSGSWVGFYNFSPHDKHQMDLRLIFATGKVSGGGNDGIGSFQIRGGYDPNTLECSWIKTYVGSHAVFYRGFRQGKGIWGAWDIGPHSHGGFHIWPRQTGAGEEKNAVTGTKQPTEAGGEEIALRRVGDER